MFRTEQSPDPVRVRVERRARAIRPPRAPVARLAPGPGRLGLGYWKDDEFVIVVAQLVNVTRDGVLVIAEQAIPADRRIWIRLDDSPSTGTAQAVALAATWTRHGRCAVRLALNEDCPAGILEALALSVMRSRPPARAAAPAVRPRPDVSTRWQMDAGWRNGLVPPGSSAFSKRTHRAEPVDRSS